MKDDTLRNIAIICSITGIIALLILSYFSIIPEKTYNDITKNDVDSKIKIIGVIRQIQTYNKSTSIKIQQNCFTDITLFETNKNLSVGENITVEGKVQEYNGKLNVLAEKITRTQK